MTNEIKPVSRCGVLFNPKVMIVQVMSGYRSSIVDYKFTEAHFQPDVDEKTLGEAVLDALSKSRFVLPAEDQDLYNYKLIEQRYRAWVESMMQAYEFKSKSAVFKGMLKCSIACSDGVLTFRPSQRERDDGFGGTPGGEEDYLTMAKDSAAEEIGSTLRMALDRCIG